MLTIHDFANATFEPWPGSAHLPEAATWIDADSPTAEESEFLERTLGVKTPSLEKMSEIEHSSRFYRFGNTLCVTIPLTRIVDRMQARARTQRGAAIALGPR